MHRTFQRFNQVFNFLIARSQARVHGDRGDDKWLFRPRVAAGIQTVKKQAIDRAFEGSAGTSLLLLNEHGNVIVDG